MTNDRQRSEMATLTDLVSSLRDEVRALRTELESLKRLIPQSAPPAPPRRSREASPAPTATASRTTRQHIPKPPSGALGDNTYEIVFDGGALGNPGRGYGSYIVFGPNGTVRKQELDYADKGTAVTNNQAEYMTLMRALESLHEQLGAESRSAVVSIWGDSNLVVNQVKGSWKVKNVELMPLVESVRAALSRFKSWSIQWHDRSNSVRYLGH